MKSYMSMYTRVPVQTPRSSSLVLRFGQVRKQHLGISSIEIQSGIGFGNSQRLRSSCTRFLLQVRLNSFFYFEPVLTEFKVNVSFVPVRTYLEAPVVFIASSTTSFVQRLMFIVRAARLQRYIENPSLNISQ